MTHRKKVNLWKSLLTTAKKFAVIKRKHILVSLQLCGYNYFGLCFITPLMHDISKAVQHVLWGYNFFLSLTVIVILCRVTSWDTDRHDPPLKRERYILLVEFQQQGFHCRIRLVWRNRVCLPLHSHLFN